MTTSILAPEARVPDLAWALPTRPIDEALTIQYETLTDIANDYSQRMAEGWETIRDWSYKAQLSDNWMGWTGACRWAAYVTRYRVTEALRRELEKAGRPLYCPECTADASTHAQAGWSPRLCTDCWWDGGGYQEALSLAREIGRQIRKERVRQNGDS